MFISIELVWSSARGCFLGRYTVLKHWSGCLSLKTAVGDAWFHTKHVTCFPASCNGVIARFGQWQGQKQVCDLTQIVWADRRTHAWGCYPLAGWQASTLLTDAWWDRNSHAAKTSTSWSKAKACFSLYEDINRERLRSANQYLHISHERKADDLSKWKITSTRLNGAHAWRTPACVWEVPNGSSQRSCVCVL